MKQMKIGAITVGQSPRVDVTADILGLFGPSVQLLQKGGLDGLTRQDIEAFAPSSDDYVLVSRLVDGSSVTFGERFVLPRIQEGIHALEKEGVALIMFFCTGDFPVTFESTVPLVFPNRLLHTIVPALAGNFPIIDVIPSDLQLEQSRKKWEKLVNGVSVLAASPYGEWEPLEKAAKQAKDLPGNLIVLDCIGYTLEMKRMFERESGKLVVLSRTLLARVVSELTNE